ncbi:MAG: hypothetical protein HOC74_31875 [Gemmatimonadetes bacterium]|jgi:hypothetical protein|nr:hypothetical protein [Gemmatimonadota bacterium]
MDAPKWKSMVLLVALAFVLLGTVPCAAQTMEPQIEQAIDLLLNQGKWDDAVTKLTELSNTSQLSDPQSTQVLKFLAIGNLFLGQEEEAVASFKKLVRRNSNFTIDDLAIGGDEPSPEAIRFFGQAVVEVRQEELLALEAQLSQTSRKVAFMRSLALPGWGQRYQGYRGRSYMLLGLTAGSIGYAVWTEMGFRDARDAYDGAPRGTGEAEFEKLYTDYKDKGDLADLALALVGGFWALNAVDAAIQGPNITRRAIALQAAPAGDGVQLVFSKRF